MVWEVATSSLETLLGFFATVEEPGIITCGSERYVPSTERHLWAFTLPLQEQLIKIISKNKLNYNRKANYLLCQEVLDFGNRKGRLRLWIQYEHIKQKLLIVYIATSSCMETGSSWFINFNNNSSYFNCDIPGHFFRLILLHYFLSLKRENQMSYSSLDELLANELRHRF